MLNKQEKFEVCETIAGWEWSQGGSTAEAAAYARCAEKLRRTFKIEENDSDLIFARGWEIYQVYKYKFGEVDEESVQEAIFDFIEEIGYISVVDLIDADQKYGNSFVETILKRVYGTVTESTLLEGLERL